MHQTLISANIAPTAQRQKRENGLKSKHGLLANGQAGSVTSQTEGLFLMFKQCVICGKEFETKVPTKCCSDACRKALKRQSVRRACRKWRANGYTSPENYEKILAYNRDYSKAHYSERRDEHNKKNRDRYKANHSIILIRRKLKAIDKGIKIRPFCCICGKSFKPKFYHEHFCSDECRYSSPLYRILMDKFSEAGL